MKNLIKSTLLVSCVSALAPVLSAQVIWSVDFEGATLGGTSGNNQTLAGTDFQTANTASSIVVDATTDPTAAAAFTLASGQFVRLSILDNAFAAVRSAANPIEFATVPDTTAYSLTFDIYIPSDLAVAVGDIQPRFKLNGVGGNGPTDSSGIESLAGQYSITYSGLVSDFIAGSVDEARPFIGIDQGGVAATDFLYMDNINFTLVPEPSTYGLIFGSAILGFMLIRRRRE
ncbi:MAG: PEP-CTERM sorting domain-containing protein [Verrucomicrobiota bacterium]